MKDFSYQTSKSSNKQYMLPEYKVPPNTRRQVINDILFDQEIIRCYVDASELKMQGVFGLGMTLVGNGEVLVKSKKEYHQNLRGNNWYGETRAICYALEILPTLISSFPNTNKIEIYSDLSLIQSLKEETKNKTKLFVKEQVELYLMKFQEEQIKNFLLEFLFLSNNEKKYNPFYTAAHNAARKIIGLN